MLPEPCLHLLRFRHFLTTAETTSPSSASSHQHPRATQPLGLQHVALLGSQQPPSLAWGVSVSTPPPRRAPEALMLSSWKLQVMFVGASWVDTPPQHRQKDLLGKEWEGTSCFHFLLLPAQQAEGTARSISSGLNKMTACSGDGSHFAGQLEELPVLASALRAGLHVQRGSSSICLICE